MPDTPDLAALKAAVAAVVEVTGEQFEASKARLKRILARCGWTLHLRHKPSGWYASAAKRDVEGKWHGKYIAPLHRVSEMETGKIVAILPDDIA
jgi:hypothetical protein